MKIIVPILLALAVALSGCRTPSAKEKAKRAELTKKTKAKLRGRLQKAVSARDKETLKTMMTENFGYKIEPDWEGIEPTAGSPGVFQYWDQQGLWIELDGILSEKFVKKGGFMVAPPQFADPSLNYDGYRAGIRRVNGSWKFAYFVNGRT
jgi:hypothetical protein